MTPRIFGISMGWVPMAAGPVWMVLSVCMVAAAALLFRSGHPNATLHGWLVVGFIALCWAHPIYTSIAGGSGEREMIGLIGGLVTLAVLIPLLFVVRRASPAATGLLAPVAVWLCLASVYVWQIVQAEPT
ncbi:MAG TPA: tryptophan-rich sensory protein [Longimicrobiales bacterium]|nr:tryptophan-rich sensory protein [Longimicrobiales bacterium]